MQKLKSKNVKRQGVGGNPKLHHRTQESKRLKHLRLKKDEFQHRLRAAMQRYDTDPNVRQAALDNWNADKVRRAGVNVNDFLPTVSPNASLGSTGVGC